MVGTEVSGSILDHLQGQLPFSFSQSFPDGNTGLGRPGLFLLKGKPEVVSVNSGAF